MKNILKFGIPLLIVACQTVAFKVKTDADDRDRMILQITTQVLKTAHYNEEVIDDKFSSKIFDEYIDKLDYAKRYFLKSDIQELEKYRYQIDDQIKASNLDLYDRATKIIKQRQEEAEGYYKQAINGDFDFTINEKYQNDPEKVDFAENAEELKDNWRKMVKLAVLEKMSDMMTQREEAQKKSDTATVKTDQQIKEEAIKRVKENYDEWMKRVSQIKEKEWFSLYINAITAAYDPHTEYLPPAEKKNFDVQMSGKFEGIGATLQSRNGQTKVVDIIPGSACWRQGELEVNDIILKVGQGDEEPVDIANMNLDDAVQLIRGKKGTTVKLTVKKIDGTIKEIPIVRDVVIIEETYAKSAVITQQNGTMKAGYIYLPKFYADFNDRFGRFCSTDVRDEIKKLKQENVSGIILDLRNNGGGSLSDVVKMSGLFIPEGPIVQVRDRFDKEKSHNDNDNYTEYEGPLVIMVNHFSASASEIIAAAMQDYNRAIIIGSNQSYGKGTVQSIYDYDQLISGNTNMKPFGAIKMTIQKFYRISGGSTQLKGVTPDIIMPDAYTFIDKIGEKEMHNALQWDMIAKAKYTPWAPKYNKNKVIAASKKRIENNNFFKTITANAKRLKNLNDDTEYSLNLEKYREHQKNISEEAKKYDKIGKEKTGITATFTSKDKKDVENDTLKTKKFTRWFSDLEKDIYITEAVNIISDMQ